MNINAERLEALINSSMIEIENRGADRERHLVGIIGDVEVHLTITRDPADKFHIDDPDSPSICFFNLDLRD